MSENTGKNAEKGVSQPEQPRAKQSKGASENGFVGFLTFKRMITPVLIQFFFWVGLIICIILGVYFVVVSDDRTAESLIKRAIGILLIFAGPIILRVYCELMILLFSIHSTLRDIKNNLER